MKADVYDHIPGEFGWYSAAPLGLHTHSSIPLALQSFVLSRVKYNEWLF
jgi:hypothetical protein